eukprot:scaffold2564_cov88-Isochrysis_galbana.AAC.2
MVGIRVGQDQGQGRRPCVYNGVCMVHGPSCERTSGKLRAHPTDAARPAFACCANAARVAQRNKQAGSKSSCSKQRDAGWGAHM